jgi:hypothetical protein
VLLAQPFFKSSFRLTAKLSQEFPHTIAYTDTHSLSHYSYHCTTVCIYYMKWHWHVTVTQSPQEPFQAHSWDCTLYGFTHLYMTHNYHYTTIQDNLIALKISCALFIPSSFLTIVLLTISIVLPWKTNFKVKKELGCSHYKWFHSVAKGRSTRYMKF